MKCVIIQPVHPVGPETLRRAGIEAIELRAERPDDPAIDAALADADAAITRNFGFSARWMALAPRLKVIASHGTGIDAIDMSEAVRRCIQVVNTPGANATAVAETTMALMLAVLKQVRDADAAVRRGDFGFRHRSVLGDLHGKTVGLVGFGHVARRVARLVQAFDAKVIVFSKSADDEDIATLGAQSVDFDTLCIMSDIISLHTVPEGRPLFDAARLSSLKKGAVLVNTARGALIDERALASLLEAGWLGGAGLDVFAHEPLPANHPLLTAPRTILSPHVGGSSQQALSETSFAVARQVITALSRTDSISS